MVYTKQDFNSRVNSHAKKSARRGKNAFVTRIDNNGVVVVKAKRRGRHFPLKGALLMVLGFFCFKALMLSANGPESYSERLALLENGTVVEAMGARVLGIDPVTQFLADQIGPLFR
ncbi:hypothetical protein [Sulfitobacter guttiformis]|uniref:Uncharacterized protein n=1 Tax=Sulfitobacter guttiformis TaxID=74349 RepID=A0A420DPG6_9RHOB|nr:hypothetical protein [Sulfitobacter guttiformis]KIN73428.1 hypothetical protein Z949_2618 [Sulfitobacter guttiformis KCTC 32187]RKE96090.1 hypothetical protein C8N30_0641 [Sulfitobacter guttiformis]